MNQITRLLCILVISCIALHGTTLGKLAQCLVSASRIEEEKVIDYHVTEKKVKFNVMVTVAHKDGERTSNAVHRSSSVNTDGATNWDQVWAILEGMLEGVVQDEFAAQCKKNGCKK